MHMSLSRRGFLASTSVLAAAAAPVLAASVRALQPKDQPSVPAPTGKRTLRKAVMFYMIGEGKTLEEKFQILRDAGFEGVEMDSPSKIPGDEILAAAEKTGIKVHGLVDSAHWKDYLNCPEPSVRERGREALETALRDAKKFGSAS